MVATDRGHWFPGLEAYGSSNAPVTVTHSLNILPRLKLGEAGVTSCKPTQITQQLLQDFFRVFHLTPKVPENTLQSFLIPKV